MPIGYQRFLSVRRPKNRDEAAMPRSHETETAVVTPLRGGVRIFAGLLRRSILGFRTSGPDRSLPRPDDAG